MVGIDHVLGHRRPANTSLAKKSSNGIFQIIVSLMACCSYIFASYYTGHLIIGGEELVFSNTLNMENFQSVIKQYLFGSIVFAIISGMLFFVVSYFIMLFFKKRTD